MGDTTGSKSTKVEGLSDQAVGKAKEVVSDAKDVIDEVIDKAKGKMNKEQERRGYNKKASSGGSLTKLMTRRFIKNSSP